MKWWDWFIQKYYIYRRGDVFIQDFFYERYENFSSQWWCIFQIHIWKSDIEFKKKCYQIFRLLKFICKFEKKIYNHSENTPAFVLCVQIEPAMITCFRISFSVVRGNPCNFNSISKRLRKTLYCNRRYSCSFPKIIVKTFWRVLNPWSNITFGIEKKILFHGNFFQKKKHLHS